MVKRENYMNFWKYLKRLARREKLVWLMFKRDVLRLKHSLAMAQGRHKDAFGLDQRIEGAQRFIDWFKNQ